jgi:sirohydrochlorin cobaltochelatase
VGEADGLREVRATLESSTHEWELDEVEPGDPAPLANAPMSSADFVYREDGRPDWSAMWTNFCELALYGGPPHRGEETALVAPVEVPADFGASEAVLEIRRGIYETTGLFSEPAEPGWLAVSCHSKRMAAWLAACIIMENVDARCEGERLLVPASSDFGLKDQIKSVITVVAKTNHYWEAHIAATGSDETLPAAPNRAG